MIKQHIISLAVLAACLHWNGASAQAAQAPERPTSAAAATSTLEPASRAEMPAYTGDFDRFAYDLKANRLFVAGEYTGTVEVFDLRTGAHLRSVGGFGKPQGFILVPERHRLIVADSRSGTKVLDSRTLAFVDSIASRPGANTMGYDPASHRLYLQTGGAKGGLKESYFSVIDLDTERHLSELTFDTDLLKAVAIEKKGPHLYTSVTGKDHVAVIDKKTFNIVRTLPITEAAQPSPLALDEAGHRLFVVTRNPFKLVVLDTATGATLAALPAPERANDVQYDARNKRAYVAGDGYVSVVEQGADDRFSEIARVPTATGAKTAILVPELDRYYVAVAPGPGKVGGALLGFKVSSARASTSR